MCMKVEIGFPAHNQEGLSIVSREILIGSELAQSLPFELAREDSMVSRVTYVFTLSCTRRSQSPDGISPRGRLRQRSSIFLPS